MRAASREGGVALTLPTALQDAAALAAALADAALRRYVRRRHDHP